MSKNKLKTEDRFVVDGVKHDPYSVDKASKIPAILKVLFIKFWFAGAVFFFFGWGLFLNTSDQLDLVLILGIVLGIATDLLVNRIFTMMENDKKNLHRYMFFCSKKFYSMFINVLYSIIIAALIAYTYHFINILILKAKGEGNPFGAEPILYGVFFIIYDFALLSLRNLCAILIKKIRTKNDNNVVELKTEDL